MQSARVKTLLLALLWALSLVAFCAVLTAPAGAEGTAGWTRTLPDTGVWFAAAVALGLGYRRLGRLRRGFSQPRLWILAALFAAVVTLGESFAQTGTAELVSSKPWLALLCFAGKAPAFYMGMALLTDVLSAGHAPTQRETAASAAAAGKPPAPQPPPVWAVRASRKTGVSTTDTKPYAPPLPEWVAHPGQTDWMNDTLGTEPTAFPTDSVPAHVRAQTARTRDTENTETPARASAPYRRRTETARGAWAYRNAADGDDFILPPTERRGGIPVWGYLLLLLACWLPYLLAVWPGTVSNDSITQLAMIFGRKELSNGNPLAQTGLLWLAVQAGKGLLGSADAAVALYVTVQALLMAWLLAYTLRGMAETSAPGWLTWLAAAFYALCPIFPLFAFCVGKDTVFAMAVLWFTLMVWRAAGSKRPSAGVAAGLCLSAAACGLLRNAGAALAGVTLLALLIRGFGRARQWRAPLAALLSLGAAMALLYLVAIPGLAVQAAPETETWSAPLQQVARVAAGGTLTDGERDVIDAVLPTEELQSVYNGDLSDPVKKLWNADATPEEKNAFFSLWLRLSVQYPATYFSAFFHNSYGYLMPGYVSTIKPTFLLGMEGRTTLINGVFDFTVNSRAEGLKTALTSLFACAPFRLLCAPGLYGWLALFALAGILGCKRRGNAVAVLPALFTLVGCLFSAVNGYFRYAMPLYFLAPPLLLFLSQALFSGRRGREPAQRVAAPQQTDGRNPR